MSVNIVQRESSLEQLTALVHFLTNEDDDVFPDDKVKFALNSGLSIVFSHSHREGQPSQFSSDATVHIYEIPDAKLVMGTAQVDSLTLDGEELSAISVYDLDDTEGTPDSYAVVGNSIYLSPVPDGQYTFKVVYRPEFYPLVELTDTVNMTDIETNAAVYYACYLLKIQDEELETANYFRSLFDENLSVASTIPTGVYSAVEGVTYSGAN